ncbi:HAD-IB family phosphatase [Candidatus Bathyarchaeota archaeon]|nr:HAD-IB family phosphatase [Candidatus Bathyarchaeota archaeon]
MTQIASRKLVIFDVEGVLLPKNRYLVFELGRNLSFLQFIKLLFIGFLYEIGLLSLKSALETMFKLFRDSTVEELLNTFRKIPLLPHTEAVFVELRKRGLRTALISSGLPQMIVENLASRLKADYAFGLELEIKGNILTGNIEGDVIKKNGKAFVMNKILDQENITRRDCVVVADDRNNSPIFYPETLKIGYNPDFLITLKSDYVIKGNLLEIVPILEGTQKRPRFVLSRNEVIREVIHASGFFVALAAMRFGVYIVAFLLFLTTLTYMAAELARVERKSIPLISSITLNAAAPSERYEFVLAPIFLALGIILSLILFPTPINYASIAIVSLGDSTASIFGKIFGKTSIPFNKGKSLEGSVAGFAFAFFGAAFFLHPLQAFIGAIVGTVVEPLPLPINDNLSTPLATGAILTLLSVMF